METRQDEPLVKELERLTEATTALAQEVERLQRWHPLAGRLRHLLWRGFLQGVASGLGRAVGATVVLALLVWLLGRLQVVPVLGEWIARLMEAVQSAQQGF
ncbi:MAG TPA: hypothetical protein EYH30_05640 [Anaerolineales bacterium]|nr:hypothetical protein [Anaerolineae bacterium]HIQ01596.1 hypothetical protein [Anaerolineales bacterium]